MSMKSLEDLERAFDRGLNAWEQEIVAEHAEKMGQKIVREVKRETKVVTGNLRRRWDSRAEKRSDGADIILENDAEYAAPVNDGHRIVRGGKTVGMVEGRHMLEKGIANYQNVYLKDDLQGMVDELGKRMRG
ncbi:MAG: HK97 gp10 family phage protein [Acetatifactor sp.]|nr:HK97 gp10 family phage protein [Acetatifactor sp.]